MALQHDQPTAECAAPGKPTELPARRIARQPRDRSRRPGLTPMPPSANAPTISLAVAGFLSVVRNAELFPRNQLARLEAAIPADACTHADAARALVAAGFLTKFQADRLLAGKTDGFLLGPYVILEQVGRGAMGRVYKARHRTMNRSVAVKVVAAELTRTAAARKAFQDEVRAAAQLNHPNIVTAYDANELAERFYLVLEFVDGPNFATLVRERGPLPIAEACELGRQAAVGLEHAHSHKMIHRDLKPTNLLIARPSRTTPESLVKIADFGIAKLSPSQSPQPGADHLHSFDFGAPELTRNKAAVDHRADLYSLGAVLYFLLTGQPPFPGGSVNDKLRRHQSEQPVRVEALRPDVPPNLATLVHHLLAKHPAQRPDSATEVADRLTAVAAVAGEVVSFDLPAAQTGPYSFVTGPLSGGYPVPVVGGSHAVSAQGSGRHAAPTPWEELAEPATASDDTDTPTRPQRKTGISSVTGIVIALSSVVLCMAAIGFLFKTIGK